MRQLEHTEVKTTAPKRNIVVLCEGIRTPENIGMIFRICDAFGVQKVYFTADSPQTDNSKVKKASRNTHERLSYAYTPDLKETLNSLKTSGYKTFALEITDSSKDIMKFHFTELEAAAIVIGSERHGVSEGLLKAVDEHVHIPMYGDNSSMNVVNALGICLYEIRKQEV